jgi:hypothetical protein
MSAWTRKMDFWTLEVRNEAPEFFTNRRTAEKFARLHVADGARGVRVLSPAGRVVFSQD